MDSTRAIACRLTAAHSASVFGSRLTVPLGFEMVPTASHMPCALGATTDCMRSRIVAVARYGDAGGAGAGSGVR